MYNEDYLIHYGVKGMKWGVRRYVNNDGSLTDKGIKKYAKKGYAQDSFNSNKTVGGKAWDLYTGAHKLHASAKYETSSNKQNKARAEQYLADKKNITPEQKAARRQKAIKVGMAVAGTALAAYGAYKVGKMVSNKKAVDVGKKMVSNTLTKSYASMNAKEAAELRNKAVATAMANGFKPVERDQFNRPIGTNNYNEMLRMFNHLI